MRVSDNGQPPSKEAPADAKQPPSPPPKLPNENAPLPEIPNEPSPDVAAPQPKSKI